MPRPKSQLHRLTRISALLKENRYPNSKTIMEDFRRIALDDGLQIDCSKKTILRDMKILESEFKCPLAFDRAHNGYYLKHHGWDFIAPALLDENEMLASVIGARIAEAIFPAPLRGKIRNAVDYLLQNNNPDFLDTANLKSLTILSGLYVDINPKIFMNVFEGWQKHQVIRIDYCGYKGELTTRDFEPHTLVFYNNSWYSKGICHLKNETRTFAVHRIKSAELLAGTFQQNNKIIKSITSDDFLGFEKITNVKLKITKNIRDHFIAQPLHRNQKISSDGIITIPSVSREVLFPCVLAREGQIVLLKPKKLRAEIKTALQKMLKAY